MSCLYLAITQQTQETKIQENANETRSLDAREFETQSSVQFEMQFLSPPSLSLKKLCLVILNYSSDPLCYYQYGGSSGCRGVGARLRVILASGSSILDHTLYCCTACM